MLSKSLKQALVREAREKSISIVSFLPSIIVVKLSEEQWPEWGQHHDHDQRQVRRGQPQRAHAALRLHCWGQTPGDKMWSERHNVCCRMSHTRATASLKSRRLMCTPGGSSPFSFSFSYFISLSGEWMHRKGLLNSYFCARYHAIEGALSYT